MKKHFLLFILSFACCAGVGANNGALRGLFSVANGRQVMFSQGNLQFQGRTSTYYFADNQYEVISNATLGANRNKWQDLFEWNESDWSNLPVANGGNMIGLWRILSAEEWMYLLNERPHANRLRGWATIANIRGFVLLPDEWKAPARIPFACDRSGWRQNNYSLAQWKQMEENGAVFLPAVGFKNSNGTEAFNTYGFYWSSTPFDNAKNEAYNFYFNDVNSSAEDHENKAFGFSVRLVQDPNKQADATPVERYTAQPTSQTASQTSQTHTAQPVETATQPTSQPVETATQPAIQTSVQTQEATSFNELLEQMFGPQK